MALAASMTRFAFAAAALTASLLDDPFYWAISDGFGNDLDRRKQALNRYFHYSLEEAQRTGRCVVAADPSLGAAAWLLPRSAEVAAAESSAKSTFLASALGALGAESYDRIVGYMTPRAAQAVPAGAWYLSIVGILPSAQGRSLGADLLAGTLAEASRSRATCYLETFTPRTVRFYERLGFRSVAQHLEPTTHAEYVIMLREAE